MPPRHGSGILVLSFIKPRFRAIAEIVHDIDLKDDMYQRPEADGIAQVLHGLALAQPDDSKRLKAGAQIFDNLFAQFTSSPRG